MLEVQPIPIISVIHDTPYCFEKSLKSLIENTKYPYELYIIDAVSKRSNEIDILLKNYKNYIKGAWRFERKFENLYELVLAYLWAFEYLVTTDYFVITELDIYFKNPPLNCWLTRSIEILNENSEVAVCGTRCIGKDFSDKNYNNIIATWYNKWIKFKNYTDVLYNSSGTNLITHNLVFKSRMFKEIYKERNNLLIDCMISMACHKLHYKYVLLDYDIYHFYMSEKLEIYPDYGEWNNVKESIPNLGNMSYLEYGNNNFIKIL